jgi:hypothetical protein
MRRVRMLATLGALLACTDGATGPMERRITGRVDDLLNVLTVSPLRPHRGERFEISSSVINEGTEPRTIRVSLCVLDVRTELDLFDGVARCGVNHQIVTLAPGDTISYFGPPAGGVVRSPPGVYEVEVQQLIEPELRLSFLVEVAPD